ncbi:MAG: molecular chaperone DnaJ [Cyanobium sp.]
MPPSLHPNPEGLVATAPEARRARAEEKQPADRKGFGGADQPRAGRRKAGRKRSPSLGKGDWGPLGKHPDLESIVARQRLHLPLAGRISAADVNRAWKSAAAEHHPDRGGSHETMQRVNVARDQLLGRLES